MPDPSVKSMFESIEQQMALVLPHARGTYVHHGLFGDSVEESFRAALGTHLPRYLVVGIGEVIDLRGTRSSQTDVIVANDEQPFRYEQDKAGIYLLEGVSAAGEVKSKLTTAELDDCLAKGTQFKKLRSDNRTVSMIHGATNSDIRRFHRCPPHFVFAFESNVAPQTLINRLAAAPEVVAADGTGNPLPPIDAVFVLGKGMAINYGDGGGTVAYTIDDGPSAESVVGWLWQEEPSVLATFMFWLSGVMPKMSHSASITAQYLFQHVTGDRRILRPNFR